MVACLVARVFCAEHDLLHLRKCPFPQPRVELDGVSLTGGLLQRTHP